MKSSAGILFILLNVFFTSEGQHLPLYASEFDADASVYAITETACDFNYDSRKCETQWERVLIFSEDGKLLSEETRITGKPSELKTLHYDDLERLSEVKHNGRTKLALRYIQKQDTLVVSEISSEQIKTIFHIYNGTALDHSLMYLDDTLDGVITYTYTGQHLDKKNIQFYAENGEKRYTEEHQYRNGKITVFKKLKKPGDNKSCFYTYNSNNGALAFEEIVKPGRETTIARNCNYINEGKYWIAKGEEYFSVPDIASEPSDKQKHIFYFRKIELHNGRSLGSSKIDKDFVKEEIR